MIQFDAVAIIIRRNARHFRVFGASQVNTIIEAGNINIFDDAVLADNINSGASIASRYRMSVAVQSHAVAYLDRLIDILIQTACFGCRIPIPNASATASIRRIDELCAFSRLNKYGVVQG